MSDDVNDRCRYCGKRIKYTASSKRRRTYCDDACRQAAYRWRATLGKDADAREAALTRRRQRWATLDYPDEMIEALSALWYEAGEELFTKIDPIFVMHQSWAHQKYVQTLLDSKRNEV